MKKRRVVKSVSSYVLGYKRSIVFMTLLIILAVTLAQAVPLLKGYIVTAVTDDAENALIRAGLMIIGVLILSVFCTFFQNKFMFNLGYLIARDMRKDLFAEIISKPYEFFEIKASGEIVQRTTSYVNDIGNYISKDFIPLMVNTLRVISVFIFLLFVNYMIAFLAMGLFIVLFVFMLLFSGKMRKLSAKYKKTELMRNSLVLETINGFETILAYNQGKEVLEKYSEVSDYHYNRRKKFYLMNTSFGPIVDLLWNFATVVVYALSFILIQNGKLEIGVIISCLGFVSQLVSPIAEITKSLNGFAKVFGIADKVYELFNDAYPPVKRKNLLLDGSNYDIEFQNVSFNHKNKGIVLTDINIKVKTNEKVLIRGKYGSGKSSLALLCSGLYDAKQGKVMIGGEKMKDIERNQLASIVGLMNDQVTIFEDSIFQNIKFAKPTATDDEVISAAYYSSLNKWIDALDDGIYSKITKKEVSSGDKQLLSFARLILKNPKIVIIDEVARNMDKRAKKRFFNILSDFVKDKTLIYISSYDDPKIEFDSVYNMEDGKITQ